MSSLLSDERLVRRAVASEQRAFAAIFDRYHQQLYRYCLAIVGDPQDAQDALQNTMVKVLRALPGEERELKLKPWLYRIAHNESVDVLRRRRDTRQLDAELAAPAPSLADELDSRDRLRRLLRDLDELPERQRGALVMRELAGLDFAAIGVALDASPAVARQTLYEARLSLQQMDEGRDMNCTTVTQALSDGDGRVARRRDIQAHLRDCSSCRRFRDEIKGRQRDFASVAPLPATIAAGLLQGLLGGGGSGGIGGGTAGAALAGGVAKSLGSSAALKGAAVVLAVAAIGTGAAERGGLIDFGPSGQAGSKSAPVQGPGDVAPAQPVADGDSSTGSAGPPSARVAPADVTGEKLGKARVTDAGPASVGSSKPGAGAEPATTPAPQSAAAVQPDGREHEKQPPAASAHGQQTAATHKNDGHKGNGPGSADAPQHSPPASKPVHPTHPDHPAHPQPPGAAKEKPPPSAKASPPGASEKGNSAAPGAKAKEAPAPQEAGEEP